MRYLSKKKEKKQTNEEGARKYRRGNVSLGARMDFPIRCIWKLKQRGSEHWLSGREHSSPGMNRCRSVLLSDAAGR